MIELLLSIPGWNLLPPLAGIAVASGLHISQDRTRFPGRRAEIVLMYAIGIVGVNGLVGFLAHTIWADPAAGSIGWPAGNPFQQEVAGANLAIGLIGFLGFWRRDFWLPFLLAKLVFGWTAGAVHVSDMLGRGNFAPNNAGPILAWDFALPIVLIGLYVLIHRLRGPEQPNSMPIRPLAGA